MKAVFHLPDLTHFKSYVPITKALQEVHGRACEITYSFTRKNVKYNGLKSDSNFSSFQRIAKNINVKLHNVDEEKLTGFFDFVFTIENWDYSSVNSVSCKTHIILQNGFDYVNLGKISSDHKNQKYILASSLYDEDYKKYSSRGYSVAAIPVTYFDWETSKSFGEKEVKNPERNITVFYPEIGYTGLVENIVNFFVREGYTVSIKQRRKNQNVSIKNEKVKVYYDDIWWPSESIFLPLNSLFCVGFGTSAYVDNTTAGLNFIDIPCPEYSQTYFKPNIKNLKVIDPTNFDIEHLRNAINHFSSIGFVRPAQSNSKLFLESILE